VDLTGGLFGWLVVMLTVGAFAAVVVFWPKVASTGPLRIAARVGMLLGVNLLVVLTAAVQLNDQFLFYAGWEDLAGAINGTTTTSSLHSGADAKRALQATPTGPAVTAAASSVTPLPPGGHVEEGASSYTVAGTLSGVTTTVIVTVPPGYDPANAATTYPVLETFSGYPGSVSQWVRTMRLRQQLTAQVSAHRMGPAIVVSPQLEVPAGIDTECVDGPAGHPQLETFLTRDVPDWVAAHFRTRAGRGAWATIGLSSGGWCAAMAAMLHPAQYGGALVMSGYFQPVFGAGYQPFGPDSGAGHRYDLVGLARRAPMPLALWVETSRADPLSYASSTALLQAARPPLSVTAIVLRNAGHRIGIWQGLLPEALRWLGATLPGFRPDLP